MRRKCARGVCVRGFCDEVQKLLSENARDVCVLFVECESVRRTHKIDHYESTVKLCTSLFSFT